MDYSIDAQDMITPVQSGQALLDDIATTQVESGEAAIWWLGQSGYAIRTASSLFYTDLYLSEHLTKKYAGTAKPHVRITHAPLRGADLRDVQWVFSSHKHSDHLDPGTIPDIFVYNPDARLILPLAIANDAEQMGLELDRLITTRGDETIQVGPMTVQVIPSAHPGLDYDETLGYPFVGYVIQTDGLSIYHSGDTLVYDGLAERLSRYDLDIALLPINGSDERLQQLRVPPNMSMEDALSLADQIGRPLVIPHHYDMFTFNTANVADFVEAAERIGQPYRILQCGEKFIYKGAR